MSAGLCGGAVEVCMDGAISLEDDVIRDVAKEHNGARPEALGRDRCPPEESQHVSCGPGFAEALEELRAKLRAMSTRQDALLEEFVERFARGATAGSPTDAARPGPSVGGASARGSMLNGAIGVLQSVGSSGAAPGSPSRAEKHRAMASTGSAASAEHDGLKHLNLRVGFALDGIQSSPNGGKRRMISDRLIRRESARSATSEMTKSSTMMTNLMSNTIKALRWFETIREPYRGGRLAQLVHSQSFDLVCMTVIFLNALFIAYSTDHEMSSLGAEPTRLMMWGEFGFMLFYVLELVLKLAVHRIYFFVNAEWSWNLFDFCVVAISVLEFALLMWNPLSGSMNITFMRLLRLCKVAKVFRIFRSVRFLGELRMMIDCVAGSVVNLFWCLVLIAVVLYIFALLLVQGLTQSLVENMNQDPEQLPDVIRFFGTTSSAMLTLLMSTTGGIDWIDVYDLIKDRGNVLPFIFISYLLFFAIAAWNIITSRFIEKALKLAQPDIETLAMEHTMKDITDASTLTKLFAEMDVEGSQKISLREFRHMMNHPKMRTYLQVRGIDIKDSEMFYAMLRCIVGDVSQVDVESLVMVCLRMRGFATSIDVQTLSFETKLLSKRQVLHYDELTGQLAKLQEMLLSLEWRMSSSRREATGQRVCSGLQPETTSSAPYVQADDADSLLTL